MTTAHDCSRSTNRRQFLGCIKDRVFRRSVLLSVAAILSLVVLGGALREAHAASSQPTLGQNAEVMVFTAPDEFSTLVETIRDGESLSPMGEMTGPGGSKWFMVKTKNGSVGWIRAGDGTTVRKVDSHFRSLPNETGLIGPRSAPAADSPKTPATGAITIPVKMIGGHAIVPVTFNNSVTGNLMVDTGAGRTIVSKRIATNLRLQSIGSGTGYGIGGQVTMSSARVESVKVGEVEIQDMSVSIHDFSPDPRYEGLLGIDFLSRFHMTLDSAKQVMVLAPRSVADVR
jgi:predicted aspartyl protease